MEINGGEAPKNSRMYSTREQDHMWTFVSQILWPRPGARGLTPEKLSSHLLWLPRKIRFLRVITE